MAAQVTDCESLLSLDAHRVATTTSPVRTAQHSGSAHSRSRGDFSSLLAAHSRGDTPAAVDAVTAEGIAGVAIAGSNSNSDVQLGDRSFGNRPVARVPAIARPSAASQRGAPSASTSRGAGSASKPEAASSCSWRITASDYPRAHDECVPLQCCVL